MYLKITNITINPLVEIKTKDEVEKSSDKAFK